MPTAARSRNPEQPQAARGSAGGAVRWPGPRGDDDSRGPGHGAGPAGGPADGGTGRWKPGPPGARPWDLGRFLGWNLPFLLWSAWAGITAWVVPVLGWGGDLGACLVRRAGAPWCPGCGLTTAYAGWLSEGRWPGWFPAAVIGGFLVVLVATAAAWWRRR